MEDSFRILSQAIISGKLKPGAPRFNPFELQYATVEGNKVIFVLASGRIKVPIKKLTAEEARIAYDRYKDVKESESFDNKSLFKILFLTPPWFFLRFHVVFGLIVIVIALLIMGLILLQNSINEIPINKDKTDAIAIAMQDPSLQSFVAGKDVSIESSAQYVNPAAQSTSKNRSMYVELWVWVFANSTDEGKSTTSVLPDTIEQFTIFVDLENKTTALTYQATIYPAMTRVI